MGKDKPSASSSTSSRTVQPAESQEHHSNSSSQETKITLPNTNSALANELKEKGLNPEYWENIFKEQGLKSKEQIQHIDQLCLKELLSKTKHNWEKGALRKLFNENNKDEILQQRETYEKLLQKLPDTKKDVMDAFQTNADRRNTVFANNDWVKEFQLDKGNLGIGSNGSQIVQRKPLQSCDVVRKISAGQLLRGQFIYKNLQESSTYRQKLIEVDNSIVLMSPGMSETMETLEFNNKNQSDQFDTVLRQSGMSSACAFYAGISLLGVHVEGSASKTDNEETKTTSNRQESFVKIDQILNVPTASITLSNQNVYLSPCALNALKRLHNVFQQKRPSFESECKSFFHEFGSHYYTGVCHLGGRYVWAVTSIADSQENRSENYKTAQLALNGSVGGGQLWFCGEIKGSGKEENEEVAKTRTFSETCKVAKKLEKFGGPQEVDDISLWKRGLAEYNDTWVIIDKELSQKCYEGVWKLIQENDFLDAKKFSSKIREAWTNFYKETKDKTAMSWSEQQLFVELVSPCNKGDVNKSLSKRVNQLLSVTSDQRPFTTDLDIQKSHKPLHEEIHQKRPDSKK